jgi:hypothetical protein
MRVLVFLFLFFSVDGFSRNPGDSLLGKNPEKHCYLQFTAGNNYQDNHFVNTDYSGSSLFIYENKFRIASSVHVVCDVSKNYFLLAGISMRDFGWERLDTFHAGEPHPDKWIFSFLYLSPSVGVGRWICRGKYIGFNVAVGVDPEFRIYDDQKLFYDEQVIKNPEPNITTVKCNVLFWISVQGRISIGKSFFAGINYLGGKNYQSVHGGIIPDNPLVHSVGISFGVKLK